jgi:hypothetical protein
MWLAMTQEYNPKKRGVSSNTLFVLHGALVGGGSLILSLCPTHMNLILFTTSSLLCHIQVSVFAFCCQ